MKIMLCYVEDIPFHEKKLVYYFKIFSIVRIILTDFCAVIVLFFKDLERCWKSVYIVNEIIQC